MGLPYSPLCDRNSTLIPQSQIGKSWQLFFFFIGKPHFYNKNQIYININHVWYFLFYRFYRFYRFTNHGIVRRSDWSCTRTSYQSTATIVESGTAGDGDSCPSKDPTTIEIIDGKTGTECARKFWSSSFNIESKRISVSLIVTYKTYRSKWFQLLFFAIYNYWTIHRANQYNVKSIVTI